jgi:hypothetical protein
LRQRSTNSLSLVTSLHGSCPLSPLLL